MLQKDPFKLFMIRKNPKFAVLYAHRKLTEKHKSGVLNVARQSALATIMPYAKTAVKQ